MFKKLLTKITPLLLLGALVTSGLSLAIPQPAYADTASKEAACEGIGLAGGAGCGGAAANNEVNSLIRTIVNVLSWVVGLAAIIMIVVSGFKYITSGGDTSKVSSAKSTLVYAIVGLVVVALSQFIVHFVLTNV